MNQKILWLVLAGLLSSVVACSSTDSDTTPGAAGKGGSGQGGSGGVPPSDSGVDASGGAAGQPDGGACDMGIGPWTGGDYQTSDNALLVFDNAAEDVHVELARFFVKPGVGESFIYEAKALKVERGNDEFCITDPASLEYTNSHHNWLDQAVGTSGTYRFFVDIKYDTNAATIKYSITGAKDGKTTWGPIELTRTSGPKW